MPVNSPHRARPNRLLPCFFALLLLLHLQGGEPQLVDLESDYRLTPLAVDRPDPLFSWRLEGDRPGLAQQAYQIQVSSKLDGFEKPDFWDSGWVEEVKSIAIPYAGKPFAAKQRLYWRARIKDDQGTVLPWSKPTFFEGGLLTDGDWQGADWISCSREIEPEYAPSDAMGTWIAAPGGQQGTGTVTFRYRFDLEKKPVVYAGTWWNHIESGAIELKLNGNKGLNGTEGPPTVYYKDFGFLVKAEGNELSVTLDRAKLSNPISVGMKVAYADGTEQFIGSSADWTVQIGNEKPQRAKVVCDYGEAPLGEAMVSPRAPIPVAWYKKDFPVGKAVASARLYISGLGYNEPYLNGEKVGDHVLSPGQSDYDQSALYEVFDAKPYLRDGENSLSVLLGDGWYNNDRCFSHARFGYGKPGLKTMLDIRYEDGTGASVVSDESWNWKPSGITMASIFTGDHVDYRQWHDEWKKPGVPAGWLPVRKVKPLSPKLKAQDFPPIRIVEEIEPVKTWQSGEKTWIVDMGRNISGWIALEFDEPAGTTIRIRASEMLAPDGKTMDNIPASFFSCHSVPQNHSIIADGKKRSWRPHFSYHGFRFAEISGLSKAPVKGGIKGLVVHTDAPATASFQSSDPLLDRIFKMGIDTHHNNMHSILEDCPHREKSMWGGDLHSSWATGFQTLDSATFYRQQVRLFYTPPFDPIGIPGRIGVGKRSTNKTLDLTWSVSPLFLAWHHYQVNGDYQVADDCYQEMVDFLRYFERKSPELIPHIFRYGDHASPEGIPRTPADPQLIAAMNFFAAADRFADLAGVLGKTDDVKWSRGLAGRIRKSINRKYYDPKKKTFGNGTHDSLALSFGIVDASDRQAVAASLAEIYQDNGAKFDGGFMSYEIYPQLTENGYVDLALKMLRNPDYPGIAQSIRDYDATTIFEKFRDDSRSSQLRHSLDHHAMNHPSAWLLNYLAGIRQDPAEAGFRHILLAPHIPKDLEWVDASMKTPYGLVKSAWKQSEGKVTWSFTIPPNSVAELRFPKGARTLRVKGKLVNKADLNVELPSGSYQYERVRE